VSLPLVPLYPSSGSDKWKIFPQMLISKEQDQLLKCDLGAPCFECLGEHVILSIRSVGPLPHLIIYLGDPLDEAAQSWICGAKAPVRVVVYPLAI
jgi:hypothetical protein